MDWPCLVWFLGLLVLFAVAGVSLLVPRKGVVPMEPRGPNLLERMFAKVKWPKDLLKHNGQAGLAGTIALVLLYHVIWQAGEKADQMSREIVALRTALVKIDVDHSKETIRQNELNWSRIERRDERHYEALAKLNEDNRKLVEKMEAQQSLIVAQNKDTAERDRQLIEEVKKLVKNSSGGGE